MTIPDRRRKLLPRAWLLAGLSCLTGGMPEEGVAREAAIELDRLTTPVARLEGVRANLAWPDAADEGRLSLHIDRLDAGELGYHWRDLVWECPLRRSTAWQCDGPVRARGAAGLSLRAVLDDDGLGLVLHRDKTRLQWHQSRGGAAAMQLELARLPASWLVPMLDAAWPEGRVTTGTLDATWVLDRASGATTLSGPFSLQGLGLDSQDGRIAADGLSAEGTLSLQLAQAATRLDLDLGISAGEVLFGPLYATLAPDSRLRLGLLGTDAAWRVETLQWHDPEGLAIDASAAFDTGGSALLKEAEARIEVPALKATAGRYLESLLASLGFSGLHLEGVVQGSMRWRQGSLARLDVNLQDVGAEDGEGRFGVSALNGSLVLSDAPVPAESLLHWGGAHLHGIAFGVASWPLQSRAGGLSLRSAVEVGVLGGQLQVSRLAWMLENDGNRIDLALALKGADLGQLSQKMGWPAFSGSLSGEMPVVRYADERLSFDGGLHMDVFGGEVAVSQLSMERPFGVAPTLSASVAFNGLDLQPLTSAFGFGEISGRMDGHLLGLRLVDWQPVAFDAAFHTVEQRGERRRISQRAVRDLTEVGGGGLAAGLQAQVLKAFSSFGYARIGLSCVLANDVCTMGGVGPADGGGYVIVDGSGLPRVNVIGHQTRVDWPVLLDRLKAATQGQAPVID